MVGIDTDGVGVVVFPVLGMESGAEDADQPHSVQFALVIGYLLADCRAMFFPAVIHEQHTGSRQLFSCGSRVHSDRHALLVEYLRRDVVVAVNDVAESVADHSGAFERKGRNAGFGVYRFHDADESVPLGE